MFSQQYQVPDWELQLQGLITRNSAIRETGPIRESTHYFPRPHPHPNQQAHQDKSKTTNTAIITSCIPTTAQLSSKSQRSQQQAKVDRALSLVKEDIKKQGNVLDIVRGQLSAFSNEINSNRLAFEGVDAKMSSHGRLIKNIQSKEMTTEMRLKALASEINILQRQKNETNQSTTHLIRQMQQELSDLKADVKVLRDENALIKEQLSAVGVNGGSRPLPSFPCPTLNDRIKTIVATAVAIHSTEIEKAAEQSIEKLQSLYVRRDEVQNMIKNGQIVQEQEHDFASTSERICRLEVRQNIVEEQLHEQSSATMMSADPLHSSHGGRNASLRGLLGQNGTKIPDETETICDSSVSSAVATAVGIAPPLIIEKPIDNDQDSVTSRSHKKQASQDEGTFQQAPEWLHCAVIEELKCKFTNEKEN